MNDTASSTEKQERDVLELIEQADVTSLVLITELFQFLKDWWTEMGEPKAVLDAVCRKLKIDQRIFTIYRHCPALVVVMERLRKGEPIRRVRADWAFSPEARRWWHALLILRVLLKCDGVLSHVRLVRWLSHRAEAGQLHQALEYLRDAGIVETFHVTGTDPLRPITWHRMLGIGP